MSVSRDIALTWRHPAEVIRRQLSVGAREDRALIYLMLGLFIIFIAQLPRLSRLANSTDLPDGALAQDLSQLGGYAFFGLMIVWPLFSYLAAGLIHLLVRIRGGKGGAFATRMSVFWALLASTPAALLNGLARGIIGPSGASTITGVIWLSALVCFVIINLRVAHWSSDTQKRQAVR